MSNGRRTEKIGKEKQRKEKQGREGKRKGEMKENRRLRNEGLPRGLALDKKVLRSIFGLKPND